MQWSKQHIYLLCLNLLLMLGILSLAWVKNAEATPPKAKHSPFNIHITPPDTPVAFGKTIYLPITIDKSPEWKSAEINLRVDQPFSAGNPADIRIDTVRLDASQQAPQTVLVPIRVTKDGLFWLRGSIRIDFEATQWTPTPVELATSASVFAFNNKVFLGTVGSQDGYQAINKMAAENIMRTSSQYREYLKNDRHQAYLLELAEKKRLTHEFFKHNPGIKKPDALRYLWDPQYTPGM